MDMVKIGKAIADARRNKGFTQVEMAGKIGVSPQTVSMWENGHNLPDIENLLLIAEVTNISYSSLFELINDVKGQVPFEIRERLFQEENMFTRMKTFAHAEHMPATYRALQYIRAQHAGQFRKKGRYATEDILYINHPLLMACQAHAMGIRDDVLLAAILLHDVVEDTGVTVAELPFDEEIKSIVALVSFSIPEGMTKKEAKKEYYGKIHKNGKACVVKIIDRCNNVSTMAGSFSREKLVEYIEETEEYVLPLTDVLKNNYPEYSDAAFLVKYQIISILETIKYLLN